MRTSLRTEHGFSLIELLAAVLVLGLIVAIAIPVWSRQQAQLQDDEAKAHARAALGHMESCFQERLTYVGCTLAGSDVPKVGTGASPSGSDPAGLVVWTKTDLQSLTTYSLDSRSATGRRWGIWRQGSGWDFVCWGSGCPNGNGGAW